MAHLTYKAADKALGVEKRKELAESELGRGDDKDVTATTDRTADEI